MIIKNDEYGKEHWNAGIIIRVIEKDEHFEMFFHLINESGKKTDFHIFSIDVKCGDTIGELKTRLIESHRIPFKKWRLNCYPFINTVSSLTHSSELTENISDDAMHLGFFLVNEIGFLEVKECLTEMTLSIKLNSFPKEELERLKLTSENTLIITIPAYDFCETFKLFFCQEFKISPYNVEFFFNGTPLIGKFQQLTVLGIFNESVIDCVWKKTL
jgi:hypothetical protein